MNLTRPGSYALAVKDGFGQTDMCPGKKLGKGNEDSQEQQTAIIKSSKVPTKNDYYPEHVNRTILQEPVTRGYLYKPPNGHIPGLPMEQVVVPSLASSPVFLRSQVFNQQPPAPWSSHSLQDDASFKRLSGKDASCNKVRVEVCVVFLKIGEIDTLKEQYEADVMVKAKWREPALDKGNENITFPLDWTKYWNPKLFIENTIGDPRESAFQMLTYDEKGEAYVVEKRRVKGTFLENLELSDFPFDVQDLTVTVMSDRPSSEIEIKEDPNELHKVNRQSFIDEQEWHLYKCIETETREITNEYEDENVSRLALNVRCRAARRPAYFFWNIFLITFLICSLVFVTFAVERKLPQNRLQLSFTLVLTSVAFKFVVNQSLPKISYLTYLDKYVLAGMIMLTSVCCWHGITTIFGTEDRAPLAGDITNRTQQDKDEIVRIGQIIDFSALFIFMGIYLMFNIIFGLLIYMKPGRKRRLMRKLEKEYSEKIAKQIAEQKRKYEIQPFSITAI